MLVVKRGPNAGSRSSSTSDVTRGRPPSRQRHLPRRHHRVAPPRRDRPRAPTATWSRDVGSLNGTYLNRERIDEAPLANGDELQIGKFKLVFFAGAGAEVSDVPWRTGRTCRSARCSPCSRTSSPTSPSRRSASSRARACSTPSARRRATGSSTTPTSSGCAGSCASSGSTSCRSRSSRTASRRPRADRSTSADPRARRRSPTPPAPAAVGGRQLDAGGRRRAHRRAPSRPTAGDAHGAGARARRGRRVADAHDGRVAAPVAGLRMTARTELHARRAGRASGLDPASCGELERFGLLAGQPGRRGRRLLRRGRAGGGPPGRRLRPATASRPGTCACTRWPPSARPAFFEQVVMPLLKQRNPTARQPGGRHPRRAGRASASGLRAPPLLRGQRCASPPTH